MATFEPKSALPDNVTDRGKVERIKLSGAGDSTETTEWIDVATQAELDAHVNDTTAAHAASAISFSATGTIAATDAQAAIAEVATDAAAALAAVAATNLSGSGSPNGVVTATVSTLYRDTSTGYLWSKITGTGNTGWGITNAIRNDIMDAGAAAGENYSTGLGVALTNATNGARGNSIASDTALSGTDASFGFGHYVNFTGDKALAGPGAMHGIGVYGEIAADSRYGEAALMGGVITNRRDGALAEGYEITIEDTTGGGRNVGVGIIAKMQAAVTRWFRGVWFSSQGAETAGDAIYIDGPGGWANYIVAKDDAGTTQFQVDASGNVTAGFTTTHGVFRRGDAARFVAWYDGNPEGAVAASPGAVIYNTLGGTGTTIYYKASGTGNTGWVAVSASGGGSLTLYAQDTAPSAPSSGTQALWYETDTTDFYVYDFNAASWVQVGTGAGGGGGASILDDLTDVTITAAATGDILRHNGTAWVDAAGASFFEAAGAVAAHEADTTSVHGIADTTALLTKLWTQANAAGQAVELGDGTRAVAIWAETGGPSIGSKDDSRLLIEAQARWDSDDDGAEGTGIDINKPAVVLRQTGEDHKGALIEFQQYLASGTHDFGTATDSYPGTFSVGSAGYKRVGWILCHYDSPNPADGIHQHMNFETAQADLSTIVTRFQISWGEDVALASFPNSHVRFYDDKEVRFGSDDDVTLKFDTASGRIVATGATWRFGTGSSSVWIDVTNGRLGVGPSLSAPSAPLHLERADDGQSILARNTTGAGNTGAVIKAETQTSGSRVFQSGIQTTDSTARFSIETSGKMEWGAGSASARDTNLYRSAADTLKTDDSFEIAGSLVLPTLSDVGTPASGDLVLLRDVSDSNKIKTAAFSTFSGGGSMTRPQIASTLFGGTPAHSFTPLEWAGNTAVIANTVYYQRVLRGHTAAAAKVRIRVSTSTGNVAVAAYGGGNLSVASASRLATSGTVACPAVGVADVSFTATADITTGDWLCIGADAAAAFGRVGGGADGSTNSWGEGTSYREVVYPPPATATASPNAFWYAGYIMVALA